jgi:hypothetical protein
MEGPEVAGEARASTCKSHHESTRPSFVRLSASFNCIGSFSHSLFQFERRAAYVDYVKLPPVYSLKAFEDIFLSFWRPHLDSSYGREHICQGPQIVHLSQIFPDT